MSHFGCAVAREAGNAGELRRARSRALLPLGDSDGAEQATNTFYNGDKYVGDTKDGRRHGYGCYYYSSGDTYKGMWVHGKQEGQGLYIYGNGDRYDGGWKAGKHSGQGHYYFKSGASLAACAGGPAPLVSSSSSPPKKAALSARCPWAVGRRQNFRRALRGRHAQRPRHLHLPLLG